MRGVLANFSNSLSKRAGEVLRKTGCRYFSRGLREKIDDFASQARTSAPEGLVLFIDHNLGGGANLYRRNWLQHAGAEGQAVLLLTYDYPDRRYRFELLAVECHKLLELISFDCVRALLHSISCIDEIILSEIVSYPDPLLLLRFIAELKDRTAARMSVLVHDYYSICPGVHLFDVQGKYCGPSMDRAYCALCLPNLEIHIRKNMGAVYDISLWRAAWGQLLAKSDAVICFSESSREIMYSVFPELGPDRYLVKPHDRTHLETALASAGPVLRIGVIGHIDEKKGAGILRDMLDYVEAQQLPLYFVVIGSVLPTIKSHRLIETGRYPHGELYSLMALFDLDLFLIPSICPETFSYTTEEILCAGKPLAVFNLGAPAERVRRYDKGVVLSSIDPVAAVKEMMAFANAC